MVFNILNVKSFALAIAVLILVFVGIFLFTSKNQDEQSDFFDLDKGKSASGSASPKNILDVEQTETKTSKTYSSPPAPLAAEQIEGKRVRIKTAKGDIVIELFSDAPLAATNFLFLADEEFYDGLTFHRREEGFVIQGGDPNGDGTGGPGYKFADEPVERDYTRGIVAMANSGPNTNGSQFFIMLGDNPLPKQYTIFGSVVEGIDVVDSIQVGDVMQSVASE